MNDKQKQTAYEILGVSPDATQGEIRKSYENLIGKERSDGDLYTDPKVAELRNKKLAEINSAYENIKTPLKRSLYDEQLKEKSSNSEGSQTEQETSQENPLPQDDVSDDLENPFPEGQRPVFIGETFKNAPPTINLSSKYDNVKRERFNKFKLKYGQAARTRKETLRSTAPKYVAEIFETEVSTTHFFTNKHKFSAYEMEFYKKYGGKHGLPSFYGYVPGGYKTEKVEGESIQERLEKATQGLKKDSRAYKKAAQKAMSLDEIKTYVDNLVNIYITTGTVPVDLKSFSEKTVITSSGEFKFKTASGEDIRRNAADPSNITKIQYRLLKDAGYDPSKFNFMDSKKLLNFAKKSENILKYDAFEKEVDKKLIFDERDENKEFFVDYKDHGDEIYFNEDLDDFFVEDPFYQPPESDISFATSTAPPASGTGAPPPSTPGPSVSAGPAASSGARSLAKSTAGKAGAALGNAVLPVVGGFVGKKLGKAVGGFLSNPVAAIQNLMNGLFNMAKAASAIVAAGVFATLTPVLIALAGLVIFVIFALLVINNSAYVVPFGTLGDDTYSSSLPPFPFPGGIPGGNISLCRNTQENWKRHNPRTCTKNSCWICRFAACFKRRQSSRPLYYPNHDYYALERRIRQRSG
jgi:curved DNA-binding protein CbpA